MGEIKERKLWLIGQKQYYSPKIENSHVIVLKRRKIVDSINDHNKMVKVEEEKMG